MNDSNGIFQIVNACNDLIEAGWNNFQKYSFFSETLKL